MPQNTIYKDCHICSTTTDIHNSHTSLQVVVSKYCRSRCQRLQHYIHSMQARIAHTALNIADCRFIAGDDMKIGAKLGTVHTYHFALGHISVIIYRKLRRDDVDNLVTGRNVRFALVIDKQLNFLLSNDVFGTGSHPVSSRRNTLNMLSSNAYIHIVHFKMRIIFSKIVNSPFNRSDTLFQILHNAMVYAMGVCFTEADNFNLAEFIFSSGNSYDFGGTNVQSYNNWAFFCTHIAQFFGCNTL